MKPQNVEQQKIMIGRLIAASTADCNPHCNHEPKAMLPRAFGVERRNVHMLRQLVKLGFVAREPWGGGAHRTLHAYKPTPAGIEFCQSADHNPQTSTTEQLTDDRTKAQDQTQGQRPDFPDRSKLPAKDGHGKGY